MKIFLDTADVDSIKKWADSGLVDGITTNPTHLSKEGGDPVKVIREICSIMSGHDVSVEVTEKAPKDVYEQAQKIAAIADNVVVKIPCHKDYLDLIKMLADNGIKINVTLVFSLTQSLMMCKLGVGYISPFIGRLEDIETSGLELIADLREMVDIYGFKTQILAASIRNIRHVHDVILLGADCATMPVSIFETLVDHPLTDKGMAIFDADWKKLGIKKFP